MNDNVWNNVSFKLVQSRINFGVIELIDSFSDGLKRKRRRINLWIAAKNVQNDFVSWDTSIPASSDCTVANDEQEFLLVVVVEETSNYPVPYGVDPLLPCMREPDR